ncbi:hypothetical protein AB0C96_39540 [Streptomyces sp. NPDC048506]|uniref:hypothetical protein n=1 Tax=Streptomyces sp. NPDC048506 TaxID=3155028 RepID=UPI00342DD038
MYELDALGTEDRADFAQALDRALASPEVRDGLRHADGTVDAERLRSLALLAEPHLVATAAPEYATYRRLRDAATAAPPVPDATGTGSRAGGVLPALGVLVPGLAAIAAALFLLFGFGLRLLGRHARLADEMVSAGATAAVITVVAALAGLLGMLVTAARNRPAAGARDADADPQLAQARDTWQLALLERGILPYLLGQLDRAQAHPATPRPGQESDDGER